MTISTPQVELIGIKTYQPEGPLDFITTFPSMRIGVAVESDYRAEYIPVLFDATAGQTVKQGDGFAWDNSGRAVSLITANALRGQHVGVAYFGGRFGDPAAGGGALGGGAAFAYTFPQTGVYMMYLQTSGFGIVSATAAAANGNLAETTTTAGVIGAPASPTVTSKLIQGLYFMPTSYTFTANTTSGSNQLAAASTFKGLAVGMQISGTGIVVGTVISAIYGGVVYMSNNATATGSAVTITVAVYAFTANTVNGSPTMTNLNTVYGLYPNQTITGTGIPASTTILSINGVPGAYTITLSANATATNTSQAMTASGYLEANLGWAYIDKTN